MAKLRAMAPSGGARLICCDAIEPEHAFKIKPLETQQSLTQTYAEVDLGKYILNLSESRALPRFVF